MVSDIEANTILTLKRTSFLGFRTGLQALILLCRVLHRE